MLIWTRLLNYKNRAIRTINKSGFNSHTYSLFRRSGILKLKDLYECQTTLFMLDFINNRLPLSFNSTFQFNHQIQNIHTTRQTNLLHITRCKCNFPSKLPLYTFPHLWYRIIPNNSSRTHTSTNWKHISWVLTIALLNAPMVIVMTVAQSKCCTLLYLMAVYFVMLRWCPHLSVLCYRK